MLAKVITHIRILIPFDTDNTPICVFGASSQNTGSLFKAVFLSEHLVSVSLCFVMAGTRKFLQARIQATTVAN
jgi:hypothetical protein